MNKREINPFDYANDIAKQLSKGILLTTKGEKVNSMTIGWGSIGVNWSKPVFTAYVRTGRYTRSQLDINPEFTINVPVGDYDKHILGVCGGQSGRDIDKVEVAGLTLVEPSEISVPGIKEFPLTLECRVLMTQEQDYQCLPEEMRDTLYPQGVTSEAVGANEDPHITYYGEIVAAYIIED